LARYTAWRIEFLSRAGPLDHAPVVPRIQRGEYGVGGRAGCTEDGGRRAEGNGQMLKRRHQVCNILWIGAGMLVAIGGCTRITHSPECPAQAGVGQTIDLSATVSNPGAAPRYYWEAIPADAGTFGDQHLLDTTFTPAAAGQVTLKLSAADGLFMYTNQCVVEVGGTAAEVSLLVNPVEAVIGNSVLLTCTSSGTEPAGNFTVTQTGGDPVTLTPIISGIVAFDAEIVGTFTFECVGESTNGIPTAPATGTVTVSEDTGGRVPGRDPGRGGRG